MRPAAWPRSRVAAALKPPVCVLVLSPAQGKIKTKTYPPRPPLKGLPKVKGAANRKTRARRQARQIGVRIRRMLNRLKTFDVGLWLLPLLLLWVLLAAQPLGAKTASGQNSGVVGVSGGVALLEAAPRLDFGGLGSESASGAPHAAKGGGHAVTSVDAVIAETLAGRGNITSAATLSADELLQAGTNFLRPGYREIGKPGSGVFRSADRARQFRIDGGSLTGSHAPRVPHEHLEIYAPGAAKPITNNHISFRD
ncbi:hypothetical protein AGMMS50243_21990 [Betaproteobacteria bacterium]|nr:hypothetical protein AGMMS50243_21990 [Betaproteobacteria bacterium]